jgi:NADPH-dependent curcumin reductase CurA
VPELQDGQVLVRNRFLSLDPYMRGRMSDAKSYADPQPLGATMQGGTAGTVVASRHPKYQEGDAVVGMGGWQLYAVHEAGKPGALRKVDVSRIPLSAYLGAVGMPGVTAWVGLVRIIEPKPGETVVVSAASGAVGSVVGQLARARGCRVVGIAGGPEKCAYVTGELGFDACLDHRALHDLPAFKAALAAAAPSGVDGCFENVGGLGLDATLACMNAFGRVAVCGMIAGYNGTPTPLAEPSLILRSRLKVQGFIVSERMEDWPPALQELGEGVAGGTIRFRESVSTGIASAPEAFIGLLRGRNFGKQLVALDD